MKKFKKLLSVLISLIMIFSSTSGTIVTLANTRSKKAIPEKVHGGLILSPGDLNGDGNFNAFDVVLMKKVVFGVPQSAEIIDAADCNGDEKSNIVDMVRLKNHVSNIGAVEFTYTVEKGKAIITGYKDAVCGAVTIPFEIDGYPVTAIADNAFENCADINSLLIPSSVTKIGVNAFKDCDGIIGLALPDSIITLSKGAFESCEQLTDFKLSKKTEEIGSRAFLGCSNLKNVSMPITLENVGDLAFCECFALEFVKVPYEATFGHNVFSGCRNVVVKGLEGSGGIDSAIRSGVGYEVMKCEHTEFIVRHIADSTCSKAGYTGDEYCTDCGKIVVKGKDIAKLPHNSKIVNYVAETCAKDGYSGDEICIICNEVVNAGKVIPARPHNFETVNVKNATCTDSGYTGDKICKDCGEEVDGEVISAKGHNYGELQNVKTATCTENGYTGDKSCSKCGHTVKGTTVSASGHSYGSLQNVKTATCTENGYTGDKVCSTCRHTIKGTSIAASGHSYGSLQNVKTATCTENGYTGDKSCSKCGHTIKGTSVSAFGHSYGSLQGKVDASCTADGYTGDKTCANCGNTVRGSTIPKTSHQWAIKDASTVHCSKCLAVCSHSNIIFSANLRLECDTCRFVYCGFCNSFGHEEINCPNRCTYCGEVGHIASACTYSTVRKGATGDVVKKLQTMLNSVNSAGLTVDGDFGSGTETAVKNFQRANGLTADGVVGSKTWTILIEKYGSSNGLKIAAGNYNPVSLVQGASYSIDGKITSNKKITSVTVGVYNLDGTATSVIKSATPNTTSYNISALDTGLKFGSLTEGTYYFIVRATDTNSTKILVKNQFAVITDLVKALKDRALANWVAPVKETGFYSVTSGGRYFGASRDSGNRAHAGVDIHYSNGKGIPIYAMESGKVVEYIANFYGGMQAIAVQHADGSVARYCEISTSLRKGDTVTKGEQIATIAKSNIGGDTMLHLEMYLGTATGSFTNSSNTTYDYVPQKNYSRRRDIIDPIFVFDLIQQMNDKRELFSQFPFTI